MFTLLLGIGLTYAVLSFLHKQEVVARAAKTRRDWENDRKQRGL